jgi:histidine triad (HIT) family protein
MNDCIFCKIAAGEIPSDKVYEDERVYAFRDIAPQAPTHILVIPKEHIESAADITASSSALAADCFEAIAKIAKAEGLGGGFRVITNSGADAGQTVRHLHFHILAGVKMGEGLI